MGSFSSLLKNGLPFVLTGSHLFSIIQYFSYPSSVIFSPMLLITMPSLAHPDTHPSMRKPVRTRRNKNLVGLPQCSPGNHKQSSIDVTWSLAEEGEKKMSINILKTLPPSCASIVSRQNSSTTCQAFFFTMLILCQVHVYTHTHSTSRHG